MRVLAVWSNLITVKLIVLLFFIDVYWFGS